MKTVGIVVEYNPLHYGHVYHFQQSKIVSGADAVIAVMSGNFLQRGEPAVVNKWARTEMALRMGIDVVIELPVAYSCQPAEWFAYGAVAILDATGVVDSLCFGSESGDIEWLKDVAEQMYREPEHFHQTIQSMLKSGISYPTAYSAAVGHFMQNNRQENVVDDLAKPNNSLGLHYLIALKRLNSSIQPLTITRQKAEYHQQNITDMHIASATAIRRILFENGNLSEAVAYLPPFTLEVLQREWSERRAPMNWEPFTDQLFVQLLNRSAEQLSQIHEMSEGLQYRIKQALPQLSPQHGSLFEQFLQQLKTKRYTRTKLQRTLLRVLLNHNKTELSRERLASRLPYLRILGFSPKGQLLLKRMKKTAKAPLITKVSKYALPFLEMDIRAASVYAAAYPSQSPDQWFRDYYQSPLRFEADS